MPKNYADLGRILLASRRAFLVAGLRITCCLWGENGGGGDWDFLRDLGVTIKTAETLGNEGLEKVFGLLKGSRALRLTRVAESLVIRQYFILASSRPPSPSF